MNERNIKCITFDKKGSKAINIEGGGGKALIASHEIKKKCSPHCNMQN